MSRIACVAALVLVSCTSLKALPAGPLGRPEPLGWTQLAPLQASQVPASDRMTCEMEQTTGSHLTHQVCRSDEDREIERLKAARLLHQGLQQGMIVLH